MARTDKMGSLETEIPLKTKYTEICITIIIQKTGVFLFDCLSNDNNDNGQK